MRTQVRRWGSQEPSLGARVAGSSARRQLGEQRCQAPRRSRKPPTFGQCGCSGRLATRRARNDTHCLRIDDYHEHASVNVAALWVLVLRWSSMWTTPRNRPLLARGECLESPRVVPMFGSLGSLPAVNAPSSSEAGVRLPAAWLERKLDTWLQELYWQARWGTSHRKPQGLGTAFGEIQHPRLSHAHQRLQVCRAGQRL